MLNILVTARPPSNCHQHATNRVGNLQLTVVDGERSMSRKAFQNQSPISRLCLCAALLSMGLGIPALAQSVRFPTYAPGENTNASTGPTYSQPLPNPWVVSDGTIITPAGTQVYLGTTTRAKAIALNPTGNHTAAVLQMGAPQAVTIFNTQTGAVLQTYSAALQELKGRDQLRFRRQHHRHHLYAGRQVSAVQPGRQLRPLQLRFRSPASILQRACSQTTPKSTFRSTSTTSAI